VAEADLVAVGPDWTLSYSVVTEAGFPYGLQCMACHRGLDVGQPYAEHVSGMIDGIPIVNLTCVYC
jgi:hypothetical protein